MESLYPISSSPSGVVDDDIFFSVKTCLIPMEIFMIRFKFAEDPSMMEKIIS